MDVIRQKEIMLLERQKPIEEMTAKGDSAVQQFYRGACVFLTGGSGFLGKQLIEKLFRSCEIKKIYMLVRPKRGKTILQRLSYILNDPLYDNIRKLKPNFAESIIPVEGDAADLRLGLSDKDWNNIVNEVTVIVHMAATVNFEEPIQQAGLINVRGTREVLTLAKNCNNLKLFTHVSTAFAHATRSRIGKEVVEKFYPVPIGPDAFIEMVETLDEERLISITPALIQNWPNTYTFTKAIAEELVRLNAGDLPVCVVKPPVVASSYIEPTPGWIDKQTVMSTFTGFLLGSGLGVMHVLLANRDVTVSYAPVDYVNNAIIAAGWDSVQNRRCIENDVPIYTISNSRSNIKWGYFADTFNSAEFGRYVTPKAVWYAYAIETNSPLLYWILTWFLHYIPGYLLDAIVSLLGIRPKGLPPLVKIYSKLYKMTMIYNYFLSNEWNFRDDNLVAMMNRLSPADKCIYNCDTYHIDTKDFLTSVSIGLRRFIVKDDLKGAAQAVRKQRWLKYANMLFMGVYLYVIWRVVYMVYSTFAMMIPV